MGVVVVVVLVGLLLPVVVAVQTEQFDQRRMSGIDSYNIDNILKTGEEDELQVEKLSQRLTGLTGRELENVQLLGQQIQSQQAAAQDKGFVDQSLAAASSKLEQGTRPGMPQMNPMVLSILTSMMKVIGGALGAQGSLLAMRKFFDKIKTLGPETPPAPDVTPVDEADEAILAKFKRLASFANDPLGGQAGDGYHDFGDSSEGDCYAYLDQYLSQCNHLTPSVVGMLEETVMEVALTNEQRVNFEQTGDLAQALKIKTPKQQQNTVLIGPQQAPPSNPLIKLILAKVQNNLELSANLAASNGACRGKRQTTAYFSKDLETAALCVGRFKSRIGDTGAKQLCGPGWHVCTGRDLLGLKFPSQVQDTPEKMCFAYDSAVGCGGCFKTCESHTNLGREKACFDSLKPVVAAIGGGCSKKGKAHSCFTDKGPRRYATKKKPRCFINSKKHNINGVVCCNSNKKQQQQQPATTTTTTTPMCGGNSGACTWGLAESSNFPRGQKNYALCKGTFKGEIGGAAAGGLCGPGWRVCTGKDVLGLKLNNSATHEPSGCFAYNGALDCGGCFETCRSNNNLGSDGCYNKNHPDISGVGEQCGTKGKGNVCFTDNGVRRFAKRQSNPPCYLSSKRDGITGVMCCTDSIPPPAPCPVPRQQSVGSSVAMDPSALAQISSAVGGGVGVGGVGSGGVGGVGSSGVGGVGGGGVVGGSQSLSSWWWIKKKEGEEEQAEKKEEKDMGGYFGSFASDLITIIDVIVGVVLMVVKSLPKEALDAWKAFGKVMATETIKPTKITLGSTNDKTDWYLQQAIMGETRGATSNLPDSYDPFGPAGPEPATMAAGENNMWCHDMMKSWLKRCVLPEQL